MSLSKLYSTPLHGVELFTGRDAKNRALSSSLPLALEVDERTISINADNELLWSLSDSGANYHTQLNLFKVKNDSYLLDVACEGIGRFYITPQKISVDWREGTDSVHYFQTLAIAIWLELNNVLCIHANALVKDNKAIALIGPSGMGKSTLSAYLQSQGYTWLTDDMIAIHQTPSFPLSSSSFPRRRETPNNTVIPADAGISKQTQYQIYPSWPNARMWPDSVQQVTKLNTKELNKVHNKFKKVAVPIDASSPFKAYDLKAIYLLNRHGAELAVHKKNVLMKHQKQINNEKKTNLATAISMQSSQAIITLVQNSMLGSAYSKLTLKGETLERIRLDKFVTMFNKLPIKQINYPSNFDCLTNIKTLIETDLQNE